MSQGKPLEIERPLQGICPLEIDAPAKEEKKNETKNNRDKLTVKSDRPKRIATFAGEELRKLRTDFLNRKDWISWLGGVSRKCRCTSGLFWRGTLSKFGLCYGHVTEVLMVMCIEHWTAWHDCVCKKKTWELLTGLLMDFVQTLLYWFARCLQFWFERRIVNVKDNLVSVNVLSTTLLAR